MKHSARASITIVAIGALVSLAGCAASDPLTPGSSETGTIVVGSQDYYSNEIIAELYAQALESAGYDVERDFRIGQREVYLGEIESGRIDLFPEYTGPLLLAWEPETTAKTEDEIVDALADAAPAGLRILDASEASDQDSYVVTREFAEEWGVTTIADLAAVGEPITLGGNSEGETRPIGPAGLKATYGVDVAFTPIEDGGGPLTVKALLDDQVQLAVIYTASPSMADPDLVALEDPDGFLLASHVVPVASDDIDEGAAEIIDRISAAMSADDLIALNVESVESQAPASTIAKGWLDAHPDIAD